MPKGVIRGAAGSIDTGAGVGLSVGVSVGVRLGRGAGVRVGGRGVAVGTIGVSVGASAVRVPGGMADSSGTGVAAGEQALNNRLRIINEPINAIRIHRHFT